MKLCSLSKTSVSDSEKALEAGVDQTSTSASKPGTSKQTNDLSPLIQNPNLNNRTVNHPNTQMNLWGWTFVVPLFHHSLDKVLSPSMAQIRTDWIITPNSLNDPNMCVWLEPKSTQTKESIGFRQNMFLSHLLQRKISSLSILKNLLSPIGLLLSKTTTNNMMQTQYFYREVDMFDLPSQYAEEVETFRHVLDLPDPTKTMPRSSTTVLGLDDVKGQQEISPRGPSAMLPLRCL